MRAAFADISVALMPLDFMYRKKTPKKYFFKYIFFKSKGFYHIASIFDMQINIKERVDVNQDGPSLIIDCPPPPPK